MEQNETPAETDETQEDTPREAPVLAVLRDYLIGMDSSLAEADFDPVAVAMGRLTTQSQDIVERKAWIRVATESYQALTAYLITEFPDLEVPYGMPVDGVMQMVRHIRAQASEPDGERDGLGLYTGVGDKVIDAASIALILREKISDAAKVARIKSIL